MTIEEQATWAYSEYKNLLRAGHIESFNLMLGMAIKNWYPEEKLSARDKIGDAMAETIRNLYRKEFDGLE